MGRYQSEEHRALSVMADSGAHELVSHPLLALLPLARDGLIEIASETQTPGHGMSRVWTLTPAGRDRLAGYEGEK